MKKKRGVLCPSVGNSLTQQHNAQRPTHRIHVSLPAKSSAQSHGTKTFLHNLVNPCQPSADVHTWVQLCYTTNEFPEHDSKKDQLRSIVILQKSISKGYMNSYFWDAPHPAHCVAEKHYIFPTPQAMLHANAACCRDPPGRRHPSLSKCGCWSLCSSFVCCGDST